MPVLSLARRNSLQWEGSLPAAHCFQVAVFVDERQRSGKWQLASEKRRDFQLSTDGVR